MKAGLESGSRETFARLAEMLASLKASKGAA
jgi:hypothetical protein